MVEASSQNVMTKAVGQNNLAETGCRCIMEDMILLAVPLYFRTQE